MTEAKPAQGPSAVPPKPERVVPSALRPLLWMGIPKGVLTWKPRLPSRNWSIFWVTLSTGSLLYYEDRRQCKKILEEAKERVRGLAEEPMEPNQWPRKVLVYTAKYPGDDDFEVGALYFRKFVKPVLVAAAVDYEIVSGTRHGGLARKLRDGIHERRRNLAGLEPWPSMATPGAPLLPFMPSPTEQLQRELDGGVVLVGRPALKEWGWAMKQGWNTSIPSTKVDYDEQLASALSEDNTFEEVPAESTPPADTAGQEEEPAAPSNGFALPSQAGMHSLPRPGAVPYGAMNTLKPGAPATPAPAADAPQLPAVDAIPAQPPICFVDFTNMVGWRNIPRRIGHFFNHRADVQRGVDAGLSIVLGSKSDARDFEAGSGGHPVPLEPPQGGDLDWGLAEERFYPKRFAKTLTDMASRRETFYNELRTELKASREILRGEREPTKAERREMPRSEVELREKRFSNERDWHNLEEGYNMLVPTVGVSWDETWRGFLRVFVPRAPEDAVPRRVVEAAAA